MEGKGTKAKPNLPWKTGLVISLYTTFSRAIAGFNCTTHRRVFNLFDRKIPTPSTKSFKNIPVSSSDISVDPSRNLWFRLFVPGNEYSSQKLPLIIFFHGGGFLHFGPDSQTYVNLSGRLSAEVPAIIASVNYRLAPQHRYPCPYDDGFDALRYIDQNSDLFPSNTEFNACFIAGDSAGGNIAHHVTLRVCKNSHKFQKLKIIGILLMQPFFGGEERTESELRLIRAPIIDAEQTDKMWRNFLPEGSNRDHEAANVFGGGSIFKVPDIKNLGFPSTLMFVGGFDPLQDWQRKYYEGLRGCGKEVKLVEYPNAIHGFYCFPELSEYALFVNEIKEFIQKQIETLDKKEIQEA